MLTVFLSYARSDGAAAAARLRGEIEAMGFGVWRDIEDMTGGRPWKDQLRAALRQVDAVLVLLTPGAAASGSVTWEWENALTLEKRVIGLLVAPCDVPAELDRQHYHDLRDPGSYSLGLARLARDLLRMAAAMPAVAGDRGAAPKYEVHGAVKSAIGDNPVAINLAGSSKLDAGALAQVVQLLRSTAPNNPAVMAEIRDMIREMEGTLARVDSGVADLKVGQAALLARYDESQQSILTTIIARLDDQQAALTAAILEAVDADRLSTDELRASLAVIEAAVEVASRSGWAAANPQVAADLRQAAALATDPSLDVKHKLKVAVPILPWLLTYEGEIEISGGFNLFEIWRQLIQRSRR